VAGLAGVSGAVGLFLIGVAGLLLGLYVVFGVAMRMPRFHK
jgi:uncharacterized iron-regulated membrane protein